MTYVISPKDKVGTLAYWGYATEKSLNWTQDNLSRLRELYCPPFRSLPLVVMASGYVGGSDGGQPLDGTDESRYGNIA